MNGNQQTQIIGANMLGQYKNARELSVTPAELEALVFMAQSCDDPRALTDSPLPVVNNSTTTIPSATPTTAPVTADPTTPPTRQ